MARMAALDNPIAEKTGKHPQEWYHGSPHDYEHFGDPASFSSTLFEDDPDDTRHWNTLLGNHFTSDHRVAEDFAGGEHSSGADEDEAGPIKHVIHAKLHMKNPKVYGSEHDMDQEVYEHEWNRGNFHDKYNPPPDENADQDEWEEFREDSGARRHYIGDSKEKYSPSDPHPDYAYKFHPKATGWLNSHPDKDDIAANFKKRLKAQGYDGIVYGNEYETSSHGKAADSAIAFEPEQIEITQHHYGRQGCLSQEEAKKRTPHPGQMMLPGTEDFERRLPEQKPIDTSKPWPITWTPSFFNSKKTSALKGEDTGRLSAPLPKECWDRYYGRHTGSQRRMATMGDPTDWDEYYDPGMQVHRGMFAKVPFKLWEKLHDPEQVEQAGQELADHTARRKSVGMHWSSDLEQARDFGSPKSTMSLQLPVVLHGQVPAREAIETRPSMLKRNEVFPYDHREREVPLRKGSGVDVFGISWKPEGAHSEADEHGWVRRDFTAPVRHTASAQGPFFHGTASVFQPGDLIDPERQLGGRKGRSYVFMTLDPEAAHNYGRYKAQARQVIGEDVEPHAYEVEPTGPVESDDTVHERFQAWRSRHPLRVVREIEPLERQGGKTAAKDDHSGHTFWHGSATGDLRGGTYGLHVGTKKAAWEALTASIGHPVEGEWDGTREYGKTLLAGRNTLRDRGVSATGYNWNAPDEDHYPTGTATFQGAGRIPLDSKPDIFPVRIKGEMSNDMTTPHEDFKANGYMKGQLKRGRARRGYFYENVAEDAGSISAVVPNGDHLERLPKGKTAAQQPHGEQSALNEMGQQDVYAVRSGDSMVNLCAYHRDVHVGNSKAADALGDQLGLSGRERSAETLGGARKGSCAACGKDTAYQLKLLMPRSMQAERDSRQPRRRGRPYVPAGTKPLAPLKQSENSLIDYFDLSRTASEDHPAYTDWDEHYPTFHEIHRGIAVRLPQELHDRLHAEDDDLEDEGDDRGMVMHDLIGHLNTKPGGWHWTADPHVAERFSHDYAGMAHDDHDTPVTHLVISGEKPDRKDIETDPDKLDEDEHEGVSAFDEGSGEKEVPLKRGTKVHVNSISWKLHNGTQPSMGWRGYNVAQDDDLAGGPRHVTASWDDEDEDESREECEHCGEDKNSEDHGEVHQDWMHQQKWYTDWDEDRTVGAHNNGEIQRGMAISLPPEVHRVVHDEDRPLHERGKALAEHVIKSANDNGHIGRFWTDEDNVAQQYASGSSVKVGGKDDHGTPATPVVLHVKFPGYHHIETDPEELEHHGVYSYHIESNREVPLQHGTPLEVTGASWAHHKYGRDGVRHWDSDNADWKRHTFKEPIKAMSSKKELPTLRMLAHDATENQEIRHCPFCGGGKIIGRNDGSVECEFCHNYFTVQSQPQYPNFPQTINGVPQSVPGMPGQVESPNGGGVPGMPPGAPGDDEEGEEGNPFADDSEGAPEDAEEDEGGNEPPPFAKKSFRTVTGARLGEDDYVRHLAIRLAPDRDAMIARIRSERGTR